MNETVVEFEVIPHEYDLHGRIVEFKEPLAIYEFPPMVKTKDGWMSSIFPTDKLLFLAKYMLVTGGFGEVSYTSGRMLIGTFGLTPEDCLEGHRINSTKTIGESKQTARYAGGNTKVFPDRQSKQTFLERGHEPPFFISSYINYVLGTHKLFKWLRIPKCLSTSFYW